MERDEGDYGLSSEDEHVREKIRHRYFSAYLILYYGGMLALFVSVIPLVGLYRPSYSTVDVIGILAVGMILGAIYVRSLDKLQEYFGSKLAEADRK